MQTRGQRIFHGENRGWYRKDWQTVGPKTETREGRRYLSRRNDRRDYVCTRPFHRTVQFALEHRALVKPIAIFTRTRKIENYSDHARTEFYPAANDAHLKATEITVTFRLPSFSTFRATLARLFQRVFDALCGGIMWVLDVVVCFRERNCVVLISRVWNCWVCSV